MLGTLSSHIYPAHATGCSCWSPLSSADVCNYSERVSAENLWPNVFAFPSSKPSCNMLYSPYCLVTGSKRMPKTWNEWEVEGSMLASKCRWALLKRAKVQAVPQKRWQEIKTQVAPSWTPSFHSAFFKTQFVLSKGHPHAFLLFILWPRTRIPFIKIWISDISLKSFPHFPPTR